MAARLEGKKVSGWGRGADARVFGMMPRVVQHSAANGRFP